MEGQEAQDIDEKRMNPKRLRIDSESEGPSPREGLVQGKEGGISKEGRNPYSRTVMKCG